MTTRPFTRADVVQQVTPMGLAEANDRGEDRSKQVMLPHGVRVPATLPARLQSPDRATLGLPPGRKIVLSVGMVDATVKRMDYLIREVAAFPANARPFLAMIGAETRETPAVRALAAELLGADGFLIRTVRPDLVSDYYRAADVFVLCSLREGFGLAYVEALANGLPIIAHDFPVTRYLLGLQAWLKDLTAPGSLSRTLALVLPARLTESDRAARHNSALVRFSWLALREEYSSMLRQAAARSNEPRP